MFKAKKATFGADSVADAEAAGPTTLDAGPAKDGPFAAVEGGGGEELETKVPQQREMGETKAADVPSLEGLGLTPPAVWAEAGAGGEIDSFETTTLSAVKARAAARAAGASSGASSGGGAAAGGLLGVAASGVCAPSKKELAEAKTAEMRSAAKARAAAGEEVGVFNRLMTEVSSTEGGAAAGGVVTGSPAAAAKKAGTDVDALY